MIGLEQDRIDTPTSPPSLRTEGDCAGTIPISSQLVMQFFDLYQSHIRPHSFIPNTPAICCSNIAKEVLQNLETSPLAGTCNDIGTSKMPET